MNGETTMFRELQTMMEAIQDTNTLLVRALLLRTQPVELLNDLLATRAMIETDRGENPWRDKLLGPALRVAALQARPYALGDPALMQRIAEVLGEGEHGEGIRLTDEP